MDSSLFDLFVRHFLRTVQEQCTGIVVTDFFNDYPTANRRPMAETPAHSETMELLIRRAHCELFGLEFEPIGESVRLIAPVTRARTPTRE